LGAGEYQPRVGHEGFQKNWGGCVQQGLVGHVRFIRGECGLRHAMLKDVHEEN
jgi:hypothetical protein